MFPKYRATILAFTVYLSIVLVVVLFIVFILSPFIPSNDYLLVARWTLPELESQFIGSLPESAVNIDYEEAPLYALLKFEATPNDVKNFTERFCNGFGYAGYDPFNAIDDYSVDSRNYLMQTSENQFYYSYSNNVSDHIWGNRCFQQIRGGLVQIRVDKSSNDLHEVWLEILVSCHSDVSPTPCSGNYIDYAEAEDLLVGEDLYILPEHLSGMMWNINVEPNQQYILSIESENADRLTGVSVRVIPVLSNTEEPYCEDCWIDERGVGIQDAYQVSFTGSPSSLSQIRLFWFEDVNYEYRVSVESIN